LRPRAERPRPEVCPLERIDLADSRKRLPNDVKCLGRVQREVARRPEASIASTVFRYNFISASPTIPSPLPGDINGDGARNSIDLGILLSHFGQSVPAGTLGDIDGNARQHRRSRAAPPALGRPARRPHHLAIPSWFEYGRLSHPGTASGSSGRWRGRTRPPALRVGKQRRLELLFAPKVTALATISLSLSLCSPPYSVVLFPLLSA